MTYKPRCQGCGRRLEGTDPEAWPDDLPGDRTLSVQHDGHADECVFNRIADSLKGIETGIGLFYKEFRSGGE